MDDDNLHDDRPGLLTRTIVQSPVVKWILHAQIRNRHSNDVAFVGSDFVRISNIGTDGHLQHIATKRDFDADIWSAAVFDLEDERMDEAALLGNFSRLGQCTVEPPPQLVVVALSTNELVFLFIATDAVGRPVFVQQGRSLVAFDRSLYQPGVHLAVDQYSRALAVAAHEREVVIFSSKSKDQSRREIAGQQGEWSPLLSSKAIQVDGMIVHVEFLAAPAHDRDHIILLLIVIDQRVTKAVWFDWYVSAGVEHVQTHPVQPLESVRTVPNLLIPLKNAAFLTISGDEIKQHTNILSGSLNSVALQPLVQTPRHMGSSPMLPLWSSWCRPVRSQAARREKDHIYVVREDGLVCFVNANPPHRLTASIAGHFQCHVGTAFASLGSSTGPDLLAAAGDMSTGSIKRIGQFSNYGRITGDMPWNETMAMNDIELLANWASVTDMVTSNLASSSRSRTARDRLFVTSGRQPHGTITEIRKGHEARTLATLDVTGIRNLTGVWCVAVPHVDDTIVLLASPVETNLLRISADYDVEAMGEEDATALDLISTTLCLVNCHDGRIVQVTACSICITDGLIKNFEDTMRLDFEDDHRIIAADVGIRSCVIAMVESLDGNFQLHCMDFSPRPHQEGEMTNAIGRSASHSLKIEPLDVTLTESEHGVIVAVVTSDGRLRIFHTIPRPFAITELHSIDLPRSDDFQSTCDNVTLLQNAAGDSFIALCGYRDGLLGVFPFALKHGRLVPGEARSLRLGQSSVMLYPDLDCHSKAFAACDADYVRISWDGQIQADVTISNVWVCDKQEMQYAQSAVVGCTRMPAINDPQRNTTSSHLVIVSGDTLLITELDEAITTVPRQISVQGTPSRLIHSRHQRSLVCASKVTGLLPSAATASRPEDRRQVWFAIDFIPIQKTEASYTHEMQPGEDVHSLCDWSFKDQDKAYSHILVAGSYIGRNGVQKGKVWFLQPKIRNIRSWEVEGVGEGRHVKFPQPVYAIALYDDLTFVACYGRSVQLLRLKDKAWQPLCGETSLSSEGVFITVDAPMIYISTSADNICQFRVTGLDDGQEACSLVLMSTGPRALLSLSHNILPRPTSSLSDDVALVTTKYGQVMGMTMPTREQSLSSATPRSHTVFEAQLPRSLTRIQACNIRTPWSSPRPSGVLQNDLVGCTPDGTIVGLAVIDVDLRRRLGWLQRLCEWSSEVSPHSHKRAPYGLDTLDYGANEQTFSAGLASDYRRSDIAVRTHRPPTMAGHVDGDVLTRLLEKGGADALRRVLREVAERQDRIGEWMRENWEREMGAVEEIMRELEAVLSGWF